MNGWEHPGPIWGHGRLKGSTSSQLRQHMCRVQDTVGDFTPARQTPSWHRYLAGRSCRQEVVTLSDGNYRAPARGLCQDPNFSGARRCQCWGSGSPMCHQFTAMNGRLGALGVSPAEARVPRLGSPGPWIPITGQRRPKHVQSVGSSVELGLWPAPPKGQQKPLPGLVIKN